tara:strand:+ start:168 stop:287 length:120 start_codon:yes stop_codon:yes gene_type:complete
MITPEIFLIIYLTIVFSLPILLMVVVALAFVSVIDMVVR